MLQDVCVPIPMCYFGLAYIAASAGCNDMLHKPCAHSNKHNSLQELQLSKSSSTTCCEDVCVPIPMCYFGLAYSAACGCIDMLHKPCASGSSQINLQTAATD
jgi:hypothetical protein